MKLVDSIDLQPCRCELMQMAIDGAAWSTLSMEHLLDRVMNTPLHRPEPAHFQSKNEGTSK